MVKVRRLSRREFLLAAVNFSVLAGAGHAVALEPTWFEVSRTRVPLKDKIGFPIRILHLSDLHCPDGLLLSQLEKAISLGLEQNPDLICLTGDFISRTVVNAKEYASVLKTLSDYAPTYACPGNHDGGPWAGQCGGYKNTYAIEQLLKNADIQYLCNEHSRVRVRGSDLTIVGLRDLWTDDKDFRRAFSGINKHSEQTIIVLSHNPDSKEWLGEYRWDLMLSGHSHGGQVVLPLLGYAPLVPVRDRRYVAGLNRWRDRLIYTTRGLGTIMGIRFNCKPEVSTLDLM